jgi:integrase
VKGREVPAGLHLRITENGERYWLLRFVVAGRERWFGLGADSVIGASGAVSAARTARLVIMEGRDPVAERRNAKAERRAATAATVSYKAAAAAFLEHHGGGWTPKSRAQWAAQMERFVSPTLGTLPVGSIDRAAILRAFMPHWTADGHVATAARVLNCVAAVLDFSTQRGWRTGDNPAKWKGNLGHALARPQNLAPAVRMAALPYKAVPEFYETLARTDALVCRALRFTILTAARTSEVLGAVWAEIDIDLRLWIVPAERMKARREHVVPLSGPALELLAALPREYDNSHVFLGAIRGARLTPTAMITALKRRGAAFTVHGFRSSFRTWAAEQTQFPPDIIELALAHAVGSGVERAYNRATLVERRRALMEAWAAFVTRAEATDAVVIPIGRA